MDSPCTYPVAIILEAGWGTEYLASAQSPPLRVGGNTAQAPPARCCDCDPESSQDEGGPQRAHHPEQRVQENMNEGNGPELCS